MSAGADLEREERLAAALERLLSDARGGRPANLEAVVTQHPELADEVRELWAAAQFAEEFAREKGDSHLFPNARKDDCPLFGRRVGDFDLLEEIGRGGMGVVYKARQRSLNRLVALKMILRGDLASPEDLARFREEVRANARLDNHAHIVPVHEVGVHQGQPYFSMPYVEGRTLASLLAEGPLPPADAVRLMSTIARAVHHAHGLGILHRDLKPSNILLDRDGQPHVTDFGLAKLADRGAARADATVTDLTRTGAVLGTPSYMAPEQAFGRKNLTPASDVYSLGTILYEMLTGRPPFRGAGVADTLLMVREQEPVSPRLLNPRVDPDLELICLQCLQKSPEARYASAAGLADDLDRVRDGEPPSVRSSNVASFVARMLRETHNAPVLENWGVLWMWHSLKIFVLCLLTNVMAWAGWTDPLPYLLLWSVGLVVWGTTFWQLRKRGGPVLFVERQIAHVWASAVIATISIFVIEIMLGLPVLTLSPVLAVVASMVFVAKAGMLSGSFYLAAAVMLLTAVLMARFQEVGPLLFGTASAACFFVPGLKYYLQRVRAARVR
jgi:serine/threonine protein kinase